VSSEIEGRFGVCGLCN